MVRSSRLGKVLRAGPLGLALVVSLALGAVASEGTAGDEAPQAVPQTAAWHFVLVRDGAIFGRFLEVTGLGTEHEIIEFRDGGDETGTVRKIPGQLEYSNVTLKRGLASGDLSLWQWREQVQSDFQSARSDLTIVLVNARGESVARWNLFNAWPAKVTGPQAVAIETLELAHEGLVRTQ